MNASINPWRRPRGKETGQGATQPPTQVSQVPPAHPRPSQTAFRCWTLHQPVMVQIRHLNVIITDDAITAAFWCPTCRQGHATERLTPREAVHLRNNGAHVILRTSICETEIATFAKMLDEWDGAVA